MVNPACQSRGLPTTTILKVALLVVLLSSRFCCEETYKADFGPETSLDDYIEKPSFNENQNLLWHLLRASSLGQAGEVIKDVHTLSDNSTPLKKNTDGMSLNDLADILSSLKQRYDSSVSMRMPSLRFG